MHHPPLLPPGNTRVSTPFYSSMVQLELGAKNVEPIKELWQPREAVWMPVRAVAVQILGAVHCTNILAHPSHSEASRGCW
jgi:hypothetical protein